MTLKERQRVLEVCRRHWKGVLVNGISSNNVADTLQLLRHTQQHAHESDQVDKHLADAVLVLPPFYFSHVSDVGLEHFLQSILEEAELPVYLYNFPVHTNNMFSVDSYKYLASEYKVLRGVKNTVPEVADATPHKQAVPDLQVFLGNDLKVVEGLKAGLDAGIAGGMSSAFPNVYIQMHTGSPEAAATAQQQIKDWTAVREKLKLEDIPASKAALSACVAGFPSAVRPPLVAATADQKQELLQQQRHLSSQWSHQND